MSCERSTEVERIEHRNMGAMEHGTIAMTTIQALATPFHHRPVRTLKPWTVRAPEHGTNGTGDR